MIRPPTPQKNLALCTTPHLRRKARSKLIFPLTLGKEWLILRTFMKQTPLKWVTAQATSTQVSFKELGKLSTTRWFRWAATRGRNSILLSWTKTNSKISAVNRSPVFAAVKSVTLKSRHGRDKTSPKTSPLKKDLTQWRVSYLTLTLSFFSSKTRARLSFCPAEL